MAILGGERLVRHDVGVSVTQPLGHIAGGQVIQRLIGEHTHLDIHQCHINMATNAAIAALIKRGEYRIGRIQPGKNIGKRDAALHWPAARFVIGLAG